MADLPAAPADVPGSDPFVADMLAFMRESHGGKYAKMIREMPESGATSILLDAGDIRGNASLMGALAGDAADFVMRAGQVLFAQLSSTSPAYAAENRAILRVGIANWDKVTEIREIGSSDIHKLITMSGIVLRSSKIMPQAMVLRYVCPENHEVLVKRLDTDQMSRPLRCTHGKCGHTSLWLDAGNSEFRDIQFVRLQDLPENMPPGHMPHHVDLRLHADLINTVQGGDRVEVTGILNVERQSSKPMRERDIYALYVSAVSIRRAEQPDEGVPDERVQEITAFPNIKETLVESFAPRVAGMESVKEAIILLMLSDADSENRGDINVLLVGDPGMAKSEMLKFCHSVSARGIYTSGKSSSAAGLTAAVVHDSSGVLTLEAGAVVLADGGTLCVDEFDKMGKDDRGSLHEVMEQQCYDDQTEILTNLGWKRFGQLQGNELVATLKDGMLVFAPPSNYVTEQYSGEMYRVQSSQLDLAVTPNHNMYVDGGNGWGLVRMGDLPKANVRLSKTAKWAGTNPAIHTIPPLAETGGGEANATEPIAVNIDDWAEFMGYYLSMGSVERMHGRPYRIVLSQSMIHADKRGKKEACLKRIGFASAFDGSDIIVSSERLAAHMAGLGDAVDRRMPRDIRNLPARQLRILYGAMMDGDGYVDRHGTPKYVTSSKGMAGDFQEVCLKIGMSANAHMYDSAGAGAWKPESQKPGPSGDVYEIDVIREHTCIATLDNTDSGGHVTRTRYDGMIYCVEVPGHVVYVRRNGKPAWCGNSCSIAKGGIVATLNARTSILAAANPVFGRYDTFKSVGENVGLPSPLLSRFDLIFVLRDIPSKADGAVARHILKRHGTEKSRPKMSADDIKAYVGFARTMRPHLNAEADKYLLEFYLEIRRREDVEGIIVTPRQLEGMIRLTKSHARLLLKPEASIEDAKAATDLYQAMLAEVARDPDTGRLDMGRMTNQPKNQIERMQLCLDILNDMEADVGGPVAAKAFRAEIVKTGKFTEQEADATIKRLIAAPSIFEPSPGKYMKI